jgi:hypothetical protein
MSPGDDGQTGTAERFREETARKAGKRALSIKLYQEA